MSPCGSFAKSNTIAIFAFKFLLLLPVFQVVWKESVLAVRVAEDLLESLKIPNGDKVEGEKSEPEEPRPAVVLVELPLAVHRIFNSLTVDDGSDQDVAVDGNLNAKYLPD